MMKKNIYMSLFFALISLSSCEKLFEMNEQKEPATEYSPTYPFNGEWYVYYGVKDADTTIYDEGNGYFKILIYNTAANTPDSIWITDKNNFWNFKVKAASSPSTKTFGKEAQELLNKAYDSKVIVQNGKVLLNAATTTGGNTTDSIYMEILFDDDSSPYGTTYVLAGYRRTGFLDDEH
jgi:hypothetical protein